MHIIATFVLSLFALAVMASPVLANDSDPGPPDSLRIGPIDPEWIRIAARLPSRPGTDEHRLSTAYPDRILRWGNLLALRLNNGKYLWLVDMDGTASGHHSSEMFTLKDHWPDHGVYIVGVDFNEYSEHWLISARSAKVTKLYATPYRDPTNPTLFVTVGSHWMGASSAEVWEGAGETWVRHYKCDYLEHEARFLRWDGPGRAILASEYPQHRSEEFLLTKTNGRWHTNACRDP